MAGFYKPFTTIVQNKPVIIYPCIGLETVLDRYDTASITNHLDSLYDTNKILSTGTYHIVLLWDEQTDDNNNNSHDIMTDIWIFDKIESWGSGPLVDVKIFRNMNPENTIGVSAGDGLLMLGREEELRRKSQSIEDYLQGTRPALPEDIQPKESFHKDS